MRYYTKISSKFIKEINAQVTLYEHSQTKAHVCTIENDDDNKVFCIGFRTPPKDDTGLTHILEHSVLCGSKKYPVPDPFAYLLKSSLATFANAFTYPDKTLYPIASQNNKDFANLMDVYLDAVFNPLIYEHEEIFWQEGWHYEVNSEGKISYNGVVYNEMKGDYSDPQQILLRTIFKSLFPHTAYGLDSGGDPNKIPNLSYEEFLNFHQKYYHPSNSYIYLYGNCDMAERLDYLATNYLNNYTYLAFDTKLQFEKSILSPVRVKETYQVYKLEDTIKKTYLAYNIALPTNKDIKALIALDLIIAVLFQTLGAPLTKKIVDLGLGDDVLAGLEDDLLQPTISVVLYNTEEAQEEKFIKTLEDEWLRYAQGLDHKALLNLINYNEFKIREGGFGSMPRGLNIILTSLSSFLYDSSDPYSRLELLEHYDSLRKDLANGYFEQVLKEYIITNPHKSYVTLTPVYEPKPVSELEVTTPNLTKEIILANNQRLRLYQAQKPAAEVLASLPKLSLADLNPNIEKLHLEVNEGDYKLAFSEYFTNDICYVNYLFDLKNFSNEDVYYIALLSRLYKNMSTAKTNYATLNQQILKNTGGLSFSVALSSKKDGGYISNFIIRTSVLKDKLELANELIKEIINETNFADSNRLLTRLKEIKLDFEAKLLNDANGVALTRALSYIDEAYYYSDCISGLNFYYFVKDLVTNFLSKQDVIIANLKRLQSLLWNKNNFMASYTGQKENYSLVKEAVDAFYQELIVTNNQGRFSFKPAILNEGLVANCDVNFVARCGRYSGKASGSMAILNSILNLDYLWQEVRVLGGAYGVNISTARDNLIALSSYRDPNLAKTDSIFANLADYVAKLNLSPEDLLQYKIGTIGALDSPLHNKNKGEKALFNYLKGYTYMDMVQKRQELLATTNADLVKLAAYFTEALALPIRCVIGPKEMLEQEKNLFKKIKDLI